MASREHTCCHASLHKRRELHEAQRVGDLRPRPRDALGQLGVRTAEVLEQLLIGGCLLKRIELHAVEVLQQRVTQQVFVLRVSHHRGYRLEPRLLRGAQAPLTHDELVMRCLTVWPVHATHDDRLEQTDLLDRGRQLSDVVVVENLARLPGVWLDERHREIRKGRSRHGHERVAVSRCRVVTPHGAHCRLRSSPGLGRSLGWPPGTLSALATRRRCFT